MTNENEDQTPGHLRETETPQALATTESVERFVADQKLTDIQTAEQVTDSAALVDKEIIAEIPLLVHKVGAQPIVDSASGEVMYDLVSVLAQPVELSDDGKTVVRAGKMVLYHAGRVNEPNKPPSIHAQEVLDVASMASEWPVLFPRGIREQQTQGGFSYWTLRGVPGDEDVDIWGEAEPF